MTLNFIMELVKKIIFRSWPNLNDIYKEEFEDTKGVIRIRKQKDRQHNGQMFEDTKVAIRICKSKKDRQRDG